MRLINNFRKDLNLTLSDTVSVSVANVSLEIAEVIKEKEEEIKKDTLSSDMKIVSEITDNGKEVKIDDCKFMIFLNKN